MSKHSLNKIKEFLIVFITIFVLIFTFFLITGYNSGSLENAFKTTLLFTFIQIFFCFLGYEYILILLIFFIGIYFLFKINLGKVSWVAIFTWWISWYVYGTYLLTLSGA